MDVHHLRSLGGRDVQQEKDMCVDLATGRRERRERRERIDVYRDS